MCTMIVEKIKIDGSGKGTQGWFPLQQANVSSDKVSMAASLAVAVARVQPGAYGLGPQVEGATVRFSIPRPMALVVQLDYREKLFLFADPPPDPVPADAVDAVSLGAVGDGKTDNTAVLQKAIDGLPQGGTLLLTAGHYRSGSLRLKSHMRLHLDAGALLQAPDEHTKILPSWRLRCRRKVATMSF